MAGNQDVSLRLNVLRYLRDAGGRWQTRCNTSATFHAETDRDYEAEAIIDQPSASQKIDRCRIRVTELVRTAQGTVAFRPVRLVPVQVPRH